MPHRPPTIRTLRSTEREALLELLDGWPLRDGWRGRDFFRRYLELDPAYADENVWVAEEGGKLVSCVQVFPRVLRSTAGEVPCGGIGSVFTARAHRGRGLASRLLDEAAGAMRARGMEVSILVAGRLDWYAGLGWRVWGPPQLRMRAVRRSSRDLMAMAEAAETEPLAGWSAEVVAGADLARDPAACAELHELATRWCSELVGCVVRGSADWPASLRLGGNPDEHFHVAREGGRAIAFARECVLDNERQVTEWAFEPGGESALATMLLELRPSRDTLALPPVAHAALFGELGRRGFAVEPATGAAWMLRCLDDEALARRLRSAGDDFASLDDEALLERLFPRERFGFWTADRF